MFGAFRSVGSLGSHSTALDQGLLAGDESADNVREPSGGAHLRVHADVLPELYLVKCDSVRYVVSCSVGLP